MKYFYIIILVISLNVIQASVYSSIKNNVLSLLKKKPGGNEAPVQRGSVGYFQQRKKQDANDAKSAQNKASILKNVRTHEENLNIGRDLPSSKLTESLDKRIGREYFHMDPVLNELRRRSQRRSHRKPFRRAKDGSSSKVDDSSDMDLKFWMDEWDEHWMQKKFEALNSTEPRGDVVNMAAARPWGVPCGDPNQHDMPWGTCMLNAECDAEYRIYRGDYFCGRTEYICCALLKVNYDMYEGMDISFDGSSFSTDSHERNPKGDSAEEKKKKRNEKNKRKKDREKRTRNIKKSIKKIIREIRKILDRTFRNGTTQRKKRTKELKKFIESMKKQYRKDRKSVVNAHEFDLIQIDTELQKKLDGILSVNKNYMTNDTFRDIVTSNGTVNKEKVKALLRQYPDLAKLLVHRRRNDDDDFPTPVDKNTDLAKLLVNRRRNDDDDFPTPVDMNDHIKGDASLPPDKDDHHYPLPFNKDDDDDNKNSKDKPVLEYDLEYGKLYY